MKNNNFFCNDFILKTKFYLDNKIIDFNWYKKHFLICEQCRKEITNIFNNNKKEKKNEMVK